MEKCSLMGFALLIPLAVLLVFGDSCGIHNGNIRVDAPVGTIIGNVTDLAFVFHGIPYVKQPDRWGIPSPPDIFVKPFEAYIGVNQVQCPQPSCSVDSLVCLSRVSEDCLYLNIFAPLSARYDSKLPVMVFIHGGEFSIGSGLFPFYDGTPFNDLGNVIVVTFNYRLGVVGFLATGEGEGNLNGNYGIIDQTMAFHWIKKNIPSFGGDPNKITLFGQSAGAQAVAIHLLKRNCFFQRAIVQSAPFGIPFRTYADAKNQASIIASFLGCLNTVTNTTDINCLKSKSIEEIVNAQKNFHASGIQFSSSFLINNFQVWGPVLDGKIVPMNLMDAIKGNHFDRKRTIFGTTSEEAVSYIYGFTGPIPYLQVLAIASQLGINATRLVELYGSPSDPLDARPEFSEIGTDFIFLCPNRLAAKSLEKYQRAWLYEYDHVLKNTLFWELLGLPACLQKICHAAELPVLFTNPLLSNGTFFTFEETDMALSMIGYWTNFASSGNPNFPRNAFLSTFTKPFWKSFKKSKQRNLVFSTPQNTMTPVRKKDICDFFANVY